MCVGVEVGVEATVLAVETLVLALKGVPFEVVVEGVLGVEEEGPECPPRTLSFNLVLFPTPAGVVAIRDPLDVISPLVFGGDDEVDAKSSAGGIHCWP